VTGLRWNNVAIQRFVTLNHDRRTMMVTMVGNESDIKDLEEPSLFGA